MVRLKTALAAVGIVVVVGGTAWLYRDRHISRLHEANVAKAGSLKNEIDRRFGAGATQTEVVEFLRQQTYGIGLMRSESANGYWLSVGSGPSRVWYCSEEEVGV
jgi:hypothetical protein